MDAFHRLSQFGSTVKERASSVWKSTKHQLERGSQWLKPGRRKLWAAGISIVLVLFILVITGGLSWIWGKYHSNREDLTPVVTLLGASVAAWVALRQVRIAETGRHDLTAT